MNYLKVTTKRFGILVVLVLSALQCLSQLNTLSPYSRFGLGELEQQNSIFGLGNSGAVVSRSPYFSVNSRNPASYSSLIHPTFQTGITVSNFELSANGETNRNYLSKLSEISIGLPFGKGFAAAFGVLPYSSVGYDLEADGGTLPDGTPVTYEYSGSGGLTNGFLGFSYQKRFLKEQIVRNSKGVEVDTVRYLASSIAGGLNGNLLFGDVSYERNVVYASSDYYQRLETSGMSLADANLTFGLLYTRNLVTTYRSYKSESVKEKDLDVTIGVAFTPKHSSSPQNTRLVGYGRYDNTLSEAIFLDTISYFSSDGELTIPALLEAGATFSFQNAKSRELNVSFQVSMQDWNKFNNSLDGPGVSGVLGDATMFRVGLEYTPKPLTETNLPWYKKTLIQVGARTGTSYLSLGGESFTESAVSAGISIPFLGSRTLSRINLGMDFGYRGTTVDGLIEQTTLNTYLGFSLMPDMKRNGWFRRSKYQ
ncbi:MAG: hypothetical protein AB8B53_03925 [Flavobacteriales bacterium]